MKNSLKKSIIFCAVASFTIGVVTSMSSFNSLAVEDTGGTGGGGSCYAGQEIACEPSTNYQLTVSGSSSTSFTVSTGSTGNAVTISVLGQSISFPKPTGSNNTSTVTTNGTTYSLVFNVTSRHKVDCVSGSQACVSKDCDGTVMQTYQCTNPGGSTGTSTGTGSDTGGTW